jgi:uncharacterized protein YaiL (DUF2058 family)
MRVRRKPFVGGQRSGSAGIRSENSIPKATAGGKTEAISVH